MRYRVIESSLVNHSIVAYDSLHDTQSGQPQAWGVDYVQDILGEHTECVWKDLEDGQGRLYDQVFLREDSHFYLSPAKDVLATLAGYSA